MAAARPEAEATVAGGGRVTYSGLCEAARQVGAGLRRLGLRRGDHVAICMENSLEWAALFYGCALIGAVVVQVNTRFKAAELRYCLAQSDAKALIVVDRFLNIDFIAMLRAICPEIDTQLPGGSLPELRTVIVRGADVPAAAVPFDVLQQPVGADDLDRGASEVRPGDVALIQYTSGTTADPKGVMLTHDNMLRNAANVAACMAMRPDDRYFSPRVFYHVAGPTLSLLASLTARVCLVTLPSFDVEDALQLLSSERCTLISANDTIFLMILNHPRRDGYELHLRGGWAAAGIEVMQQPRYRLGLRHPFDPFLLSPAAPHDTQSRRDQPVAVRPARIP